MTDHRTILLVILFLGVSTLALIGIVGIGVAQGKDLPDGVWTLAGGAIGSLSSLLVSTRGGSSEQGTVTASVDVTARPEE